MKIGIVTCKKVPELEVSERVLIPLFADRAISASVVVWTDASVNWGQFDYLIIRSIWDYHLKPIRLKAWLDMIDELGIPTLNPTSIIRDNIHKFYLQQLEKRGARIVPTLFISQTEKLDLSSIIEKGWERAIIKPAISATAYLTEKFDSKDLIAITNKYKSIAQERDLLVQPFMPEITDFGELSIIFFNRRYSHTVLKRATGDDFRVQSDFGGTAELYPVDQDVITQAQDILSLYSGDILYARVDGIIHNANFVLMELELIEPSLFFDICPDAIERFVTGFLDVIGSSGS